MKKITKVMLASLTVISLGLSVAQGVLADTTTDTPVETRGFFEDHSHNHSSILPSWMI